MPERSLTSLLDPVFEYFARESGLSTADLSSKWGAETLGVTIEGVSNMLLTPLTTKIVGLAVGFPAWITAIYGKNVASARLRDELYVLGNHMISRLIDPKPSDIVELRMDIDKLVAGLKLGDAGRVTDALLRSPEELKAMIAALTGPRYAVPAAPPTPPPTAPPTVPTALAPVTQVYA
jgi:hypothetical protein